LCPEQKPSATPNDDDDDDEEEAKEVIVAKNVAASINLLMWLHLPSTAS
jgi:hypothetical protein